MLTRESIICCVTTILLIAYLVVTFIMTNNLAAAATTPASNPVIINIEDNSDNLFVTHSEVERLIAPHLPERGTPIVASEVNTMAIEDHLNGVDNIEWARCSRTSADRILVEVVPMKPVARVFDGDSSYYINRQGKRLTASLRYRSDVPVIQGHIDTPELAKCLLPLLDTIAARPNLRELVTSIKVTDARDVLLVPSIRGHIIAFGAPDRDIADKFDRLTTMYRNVLPVKGWDYYDTLSVKFGHQVVATRRFPKKKIPTFIADPEGDAAEDTMLDDMLAKPQDDSRTADETSAAIPPAPAPDEPEPIIVIQQ